MRKKLDALIMVFIWRWIYINVLKFIINRGVFSLLSISRLDKLKLRKREKVFINLYSSTCYLCKRLMKVLVIQLIGKYNINIYRNGNTNRTKSNTKLYFIYYPTYVFKYPLRILVNLPLSSWLTVKHGQNHTK